MSNISKISLGGEVYDITLTQEKFNTLLKGGSPGLTYEISEDGTYAICTKRGSCKESDVVIASEYEGVPVTSIGDNVFSGYLSLTSITIPNSVTSIGKHAFHNTSLTSITIPDSMTSIGERAFWGCGKLTSITIHNSVTSIGEYAFEGCSSLTSITIPDSVTSIGECAFWNCDGLTSITIPASVTSIGFSAFDDCTSLKSITIPDSVTSIGSSAFDNCSSLTIYCEAESKPEGWDADWNSENRPVVWGAALDIPAINDKLNTILTDKTDLLGSEGLTYELSEDGTYATCTGIGDCTDTDVVIASTYQGLPVTSISERAFEDCSSLTNITIPDSITSIGDSAFRVCTSLENATIPAFAASYLPRTNLKNVTITSGTSIGEGAFSWCESLTGITISDSVTSIGYNAFYHCTSLTRITISDSVESIGEYAFAGCTSLESINIPSSATSISANAFYDCSSLESLIIPDSVESIGYWAFYNCSSLIIYCEAESKPEGWADTWNYSNRPVVWGAALDFTAVNDKLIEIQESSIAELLDTNVKLGSELKTYYNVGKITNASGTNPVTIGYEGDTLRDVFNNLFNMDEVQPTITSYPSVSCTLSSDASNERGTYIYSVSYSINFEDGEYTNSNTTGVTMTGYSFSNGTASNTTDTSGTLTLPSTYTVGTSSTFSTTLTATHSQGNVAETNLGNNSNPEIKISAGSCEATPTFSKTAVDYPYFISSSAATIEALDMTAASNNKKTTSLTSSTGETCNYNADAYVWIFVRKGTTATQPSKTIQAYSDIAKEWGTFLGGTDLMETITFNKANGVSDTFFAYRTKNTAGAADSAKFRLN